MRKPTKCAGFTDDGKAFACPNPPGTPWTDYWCLPCDEKRRARITRQLHDLQRDLAVAAPPDPESETP